MNLVISVKIYENTINTASHPSSQRMLLKALLMTHHSAALWKKAIYKPLRFCYHMTIEPGDRPYAGAVLVRRTPSAQSHVPPEINRREEVLRYESA